MPLSEASFPPLADLAARMQLDSPGSPRSPFAGAPAVRDLAEEAGFPYLLSQSGQAGGVRMDLEDEHNEHNWSQASYSDAESAASSIGRRSAASSSLSSIGRGRPRPPPTHREGVSFASPVPASPDRINHHNPWRKEEDKRLIQLVAAQGPRQWSVIAQILNIGRTGKQCRERWDPATPPAPRPASLKYLSHCHRCMGARARRWLNHLSPDVQSPGEWTEQEDSKLRDLVEKYRGSLSIPWSKIGKMFPGRTAAWSKVPSEFRGWGCSRSQKQPVRPPAAPERDPPACSELPSKPERRALATWMPKRGSCGSA